MKNKKPLICPKCGIKHYYYNMNAIYEGIECRRCWFRFQANDTRVYVGVNDGWYEDLMARVDEKEDIPLSIWEQVKTTVRKLRGRYERN